MKKIILLSAALMLSLMLPAQTQQGYVKTKGRMVNGKLVPGQGLKGATVSIKGRTSVVVNKDDGSFSFPVAEAQFRVDSVRKKGYQLVDMDALSKTYKHSTNPIYLVMETPEQQLQDQLAAERKIRRPLTNQLHQKEDEIERLKEQQKISDEEYRQAFQKLYEETKQNDQLVKDMVERYSKIDYDQLSESDKQISEYILNGELTKADSLLRTKGDINQRAKAYQKHKAINAKEKGELSQRQEQLEQSELLTQKELEDLANDCYRKFEIFKMQHLNDSAAYYLELRAELDSTNIEWLIDAGAFFLNFTSKFDIALDYFNRSINKTLENDSHSVTLAHRYSLLGSAYNELEDFDNALKNNKLSLAVSKSSTNGIIDITTAYNDIGYTYFNKGLYDTAIEYYDSALIVLKSFQCDKNDYLSATYNNIGSAYCSKDDYDKALEYYEKSLKIRDSINNPIDLATSYNNIGMVYLRKNDFSHAIYYSQKTLDILSEWLGELHPKVSTTYTNLGYIYYLQEDYSKAMEFYKKALSIEKKILNEKSMHIAHTYNNIASLYDDISEYDSAIIYHEKAIDIAETILGYEHPRTATYYVNIGHVYYNMGKYDEAIKYNKKTLAIIEKTLGKNHIRVANCNDNIALIYKNMGDFGKALEHYNIALSILRNTVGEDHPNTIKTQQKIAEIQAKLKEQENQPNE